MHYLEALISGGEGLELDFKKTIRDSRKIARSLVAFANTRGGRLLIGVRDNGTLAGVESEEEVYMVESAALVYCRPEVKFTAQAHRLEGKTILEIIIPGDGSTLYEAQNEEGKWEILIRDGDECRTAAREYAEIVRLRRQNKGSLLKMGPVERRVLEILRDRPEGYGVREVTRKIKAPVWKVARLLTRLAAADIVGYDPLTGLFRV